MVIAIMAADENSSTVGTDKLLPVGTNIACMPQPLLVAVYESGLLVYVFAPAEVATTHPRNVKPVPGVAV